MHRRIQIGIESQMGKDIMVTFKLRPIDRKRVKGEVGWRCIFQAYEDSKADRIW